MAYRNILDYKAAIFDGDNTLWKGRIAKGIGKKYLLRELKKGNLGKFFSGVVGALDVDSIVKEHGERGEAYGLEKFYDILVKNGLGTKDEMYNFATQHIDEKKVHGAKEFIEKWYLQGKPVFIATIGGTTAAMAAKDYFRLEPEFISNTDVFDNVGQLVKAQLTILDGTDKLKAVEKMLKDCGFEIEDCLVIGDSANDIPILKKAGIACASPYATEEVKSLCERNVENTYIELLNN